MRYVRNFQDMERHENFSSSMVRREKGTRESFSLADCTSVAWRHRNREKPNLSSLPPTIKHTLHRVSPFFFMPFLPLFQVWSTETPTTVVALSGTFTMSRFTCLLYQKRRSQAELTFPSSGATVIIVVCFSFITLSLVTQIEHDISGTHISRNYYAAAIVVSMDNIEQRFKSAIILSAYHRRECFAIMFHVPISLI